MPVNALRTPPQRREHFILEVVNARLTLRQTKSVFPCLAPTIYVKASVGETKQRTNAKPFRPHIWKTSQVWKEELPFALSRGSSLDLEVFRVRKMEHSIHKDNINVDEELRKDQESEDKRDPTTIHFSSGTLRIFIKASDAEKNAQLAIENLERDIKTEFGSKVGDMIKSFVDLAEEGKRAIQSDFAGALVDAIPILDTIVKAADTLSKAHPILKVAWFATSALYKIVSDQVKFDKGVRDLVADLAKAFSFIRDVEGIRNKLDSLEETIEELLVLITMCCLCIRTYARQSFARRTMATISKDEIKKFKDDLVKLGEELDRRIDVNAAIAIDRVEIAVNRGDMRQQRRDLERQLESVESDLRRLPICMDGTRVTFLDTIANWAKSSTTPNILWLSGAVGSGKSTIARTIISKLNKDNNNSRFGGYFLFERGKSDPDTVVEKIALGLMQVIPELVPHISNAIRNKNLSHVDHEQCFEDVLKGPLKKVEASVEKPFIIVLDALEQCGDETTRERLMALLRDKFPELPPIFRFLITSRPEPDIKETLISPSVRHVKLEHTSNESRTDVKRYIEKEMNEVIGKLIPVDWLETLSNAADGLFIFASVAVGRVKKRMKFGPGPCEKLRELVKDVSSIRGFGLDDLYKQVLEDLELEGEAIVMFSRILGTIVLGKILLTEDDIDQILYLPVGETKRCLENLQSVLFYDAGRHVSPFHASFTDYLLAHEKRSADPWFIDVAANDVWLAPRCFDLMSELSPNICSLDSPLKFNNEVADLETRVQSNIPVRLRYACLHWAQHLRGVPGTSDLSSEVLGKLKAFLDEKLLCWFEVLSLTNEFSRFAGPSLLEAIRWIPVEKKNFEIKTFLQDARKLAHTFAAPISQSAPHIYLSMLPFSQGESVVADHYFEKTPYVVQVERIGIKEPSPLLNELRLDARDYVKCLSFSPDAKYIAYGSSGGKVRLLDAETGEAISKSFKGSERGADSIAFSPLDGRYLICGTGHGIRVWEVETGKIVRDLPEAHADHISSVALCRHKDGTLMIGSGSKDKTVKVWDAETGVLKFGPLKCSNGPICSVAFSPDGSAIASGYSRRDVVVWDLKSNGRDETLPMPSGAYCVVFSHDGSHLACGSDGEIVVWKDEKGTRVPTSLQGHDDYVRSIAFSPDDQFIASGSRDDRRVLLWEIKSGQIVSSFMGHGLVAYSPDGTRIVSATYNTITIWDAEVRVTEPEPEPGSREYIEQVAINARSDILAVSGDDMKIWNADGVLVAVKPLERHVQSAFSHDGRHLALAGEGVDRLSILDTEINPLKPARPPIEIGMGHHFSCFGVSDDDTLIAFGSDLGDIRVYPSELRFFDGRSVRLTEITVISFSSDNRHIASGEANGKVHLLDIHDGKEVFSWSFSDACIDSIAFSRDGTKIAVGHSVRDVEAGYLSVIDVGSKRVEVDHVQRHSRLINALNFSPDGKSVVSCSSDKTVVVCNAGTGEVKFGPLTGHSHWVNSVKFSPDGQRIVSGSHDGTVRVWNVEKPMLLSAPSDNPGDSRWQRRFKDCVGALVWWKLGDDGWIRDDKQQLLVWVPPDSRLTLLRPENTAVLNRKFSTRLTFISEADRWFDYVRSWY